MEMIVWMFYNNQFEIVAEVENEVELRKAYGTESDYIPRDGRAIEIRHPFNKDLPMLAVPRAR